MRVKPRRWRGFTLIELLLVISILSILMGFLFTSLRAVRRYSREMSTRTELANLEAAFRLYHDHYGQWPVDDYDLSESRVLIDEDVINTLAGKPDMPLNPDQIPFFEIFRVGTVEGKKAAINAWGESYGKPYYAKFDVDGDNTLILPEGGEINRSVIVWTEHPERKTDSETKYLGSWQQ